MDVPLDSATGLVPELVKYQRRLLICDLVRELRTAGSPSSQYLLKTVVLLVTLQLKLITEVLLILLRLLHDASALIFVHDSFELLPQVFT